MSATIRPVSGRQFEVRRGPAVVRVGQVAAVLREFSVGGISFTETWADDVAAPMGCGLLLAPWPNRVAGGRWTYRGKVMQLDLTEPAHGNATHGLLRNTVYELVDRTPESVTLAAQIYPQHGYPFSIDVDVTYALTDDGLRVTVGLRNIGADAAPFGVGSHPYLRVGEHPAADLVLTVAAGTRAVTNEAKIPTGLEPVIGGPLDLRAGARIGDLAADTAFTDLQLADGLHRHRLDAPDGTGVELWAEPAFGWVQVFTPGNFPGPDSADQRTAVAIEPMTCSADALNNGFGLLDLEPGERFNASWGLRPLGF